MGKGWAARRKVILERDEYTCAYCGYKSEKYQIVHHIDDNADNNDEDNLQTVCPMCNLILHAGMGCVVLRVVDLYEQSNYPQEDIIRITREMRNSGASDSEIIEHLGLKNKMQFRTDRDYLRYLFGFITSRFQKRY